MKRLEAALPEGSAYKIWNEEVQRGVVKESERDCVCVKERKKIAL